jgi:hypothetical protein
MPAESKKRTNNPDYEVGYGCPPRHTRFQKGKSGNPSGRRKYSDSLRGQQLLAQELRRAYSVREGDKVERIPASQAILRSIVLSALKGKPSAQRMLFEVPARQDKPAIAAAVINTCRHADLIAKSLIVAKPSSPPRQRFLSLRGAAAVAAWAPSSQSGERHAGGNHVETASGIGGQCKAEG